MAMTKEQSDLFDKMLDEQAKALAQEKANGTNTEEEVSTKRSIRDTLSGFREYITSAKFKLRCFNDARKAGCDYKIVKNLYVRTVLEKIADALGLVITICSEIIQYAVEFIGRLINGIVNLCVTICKKIIQVFTLNCGSAVC